MMKYYLITLLLIGGALNGQTVSNFLGGGINLNIFETGQNIPNQTFTTSESSQFTLGLSPYWYREKEKSGVGYGLITELLVNKREVNGQTLKRTNTSLGFQVFWRYLVANPSPAWRIFLSPRGQLNYTTQPGFDERDPINRLYSFRADFGPTLTWNVSDKFRLVLDYRLFDYTYSYLREDGQEGFIYSHSLGLEIRPTAGILGVEFQL